jgi:hypothetical protein
MRSRRAALLLVAATTASLAVASAPATASGISLQSSTKTTVTHGVQRWSISWTNQHGYQHGFVMSVDLTVPGLHINPGVGYGMVNRRETTTGIAARVGAIGGINGDLFDWDTSLPWGGVAVNGVVYKTPKRDRPSQLYITARGRVGIGALNWTAAVTQLSSTGKRGAGHTLNGVNSLGLANDGHLTMFTPSITGESLEHCAAVTGRLDRRVLTVYHVYNRFTAFDRPNPGHRMLAACGTAGQWLLSHAAVKQRLLITHSLTTTSGAEVSSFISGQRTLRLNGAAYRDTTGFHTSGINPETAACVSRDGQHLLLIAVDGWIGRLGGGNGITLPELGDLVAALHCYSTVVLDGGGSTTMVEKRSGTMHILNRMPIVYGQRPVSNALLVFKS